ncbi:beta galactosidase jelly roll domain-containing protein, partial [Streptomyces sp. NPDC048279]|uniref:beta galactosidase jelly roll domain-containing protein n=1 Tax=Streptomyces sp. NPDC048279 TaxID=3154714 RepID=UPI00341CEFC1
MASQTTPPTPGSPEPPVSRRGFLGTASALAAGALAAGAVGTFTAGAQAATGAPAAGPAGLSPARWIWYPEGDPRSGAPAGHRYFRTSFTVAEGEVTDAQLVVTGDDSVDVWLNGKPLAASPRAAQSWREALYVDLRSAVTAGTNTIALAGRNEGGSAGVIGRIRVLTSGGTTDVVTDGRWSAGKDVPTGWEQPGFAAEGWPATRDLGGYGTAPWYARVAAPD